MFDHELLGLLLQKAQAGDRAPQYISDIHNVLDPRRAGSVTSTLVGPAAIGAATNVFNIPRPGLYYIEASIFAFAGAVGIWELVAQTAAAVDFWRQLAVSTSQGWRWGPYKMLFEGGDIIRITNTTALGVGDTAVATIVNWELAASA